MPMLNWPTQYFERIVSARVEVTSGSYKFAGVGGRGSITKKALGPNLYEIQFDGSDTICISTLDGLRITAVRRGSPDLRPSADTPVHFVDMRPETLERHRLTETPDPNALCGYGGYHTWLSSDVSTVTCEACLRRHGVCDNAR